MQLNDFIGNTILAEVAWEVCNQVGGIYTVIRSKLPATIENWDDNYFVIGPYISEGVNSEFEETHDLSDSLGETVKRMRAMGLDVQYGRWLVSGRPKAVLLNPYSIYSKLNEIKYYHWENHHIDCRAHDELIDKVVAFGEMVRIFLRTLRESMAKSKKLIVHCHEWMGGTCIPDLRKDQLDAKIVFTTHATILGRYLAMNDGQFYDHLERYDWAFEAQKFNIQTQVHFERAAAHGSHVFSTVSDVTAKECVHLLGRKPDIILPNGLNIERFTAMHEFQNLHQRYKEKIHRFVMGHFFPSYSFDLDKTLYFFTSGRYEFRNKGFDLTLEALARLNWRLQKDRVDVNVVMFFVTKRPYYSINPKVLQQRASLEELKNTCADIEDQVGDRLFYMATLSADQKLPPLNDFVDEHLRLRYRRTIQSWKTKELPLVITHTLCSDHNDEILTFLRGSNLVNNSYDRVKVVYHPDFISSINPLFHMDYDNFVRGCHMGIFPSYYEPWGYTPLECMARGIPALTSDLSGFGDFVLKECPELQNNGVYVVKRAGKSFHEAAKDMADKMYHFVMQDRRSRIIQRNQVELGAQTFDWDHLRKFYDKAYAMALST